MEIMTTIQCAAYWGMAIIYQWGNDYEVEIRQHTITSSVETRSHPGNPILVVLVLPAKIVRRLIELAP